MTRLRCELAKEADYLIYKCLSEIFKDIMWYSNSEGRYGESGRKGDSGEGVVERYFIENSIQYDKKDDHHSQVNLKIDFTVDGNPIDVKTNIFKGFLGVELFNEKADKGWIYTTTAKEIYGVDLVYENIYRYKVSDMLAHVEKNKHKAKPVKNGAYMLWVSKNESFIEKLQ